MTSTTARRHLTTRRGTRHLAVAVAVAATALTGACTGSSPALTAAPVTTTPSVTSSASVPAPAVTTLAPVRTSPAATTPSVTPSATSPALVPQPVGATARPDASGIVWDEVGAGWVVTLSSSAPTASDGSNPGPFTLALVSPTGVRHAVMSSTQQVRLASATPDGHRVLGIEGFGSTQRLVEWDLVARTSHTIPLPAVSYPVVTYTRPTGQQVLVSGFRGLTQRVLVRMTRAGHVEASIPMGGGDGVSTADGTRLVVSPPTGPGLRVLDNATGRVQRTVTDPAGYQDCGPVLSWSGSDIEVRCQLTGRQSYDLLLLSASTGSYRALTHTDVADESELFGYAVAWPLPGGVLAERATGCGPGEVGLLDRSGRIGTGLTWAGAVQPPGILGVVGTRVYAQLATCGSAPSRLVSQDAYTHRSTTLASGSALEAVVLQDR